MATPPAPVASGGGGSAADTGERVRELWAARTTGGVPTDFCLGAGDLLEINVFHWEEMQGLRTRISTTGNINLPMLGEMPAAGLTEAQLRDQIAARLRDGIMRRPHVSVFVAEYASQQVSVTGAVARPGLISLTRESRTLSHVLSEAGGLSEQAGGRILFYPALATDSCGRGPALERPVVTTRPPEGVNPIEIDVNEEYEPATENPLLLPVIGGDRVVVNRGQFLVDGWVERPGAFDISPGITAFGGLTAAGGATFPADLSRVTVWRNLPNGAKRRIDVDMDRIVSGEARDVTLQAGDVVKVPSSKVKLVPYSLFWVITNIVNVGAGLSLGV